ncbi:MAG TPA: hypothetical protein VJA21_11020 [Verrucomicrobiae bacterium]
MKIRKSEKRNPKSELKTRPNGVKRRTFVRMKKIFGWLQDGLHPNCTSIARDLEVSVKTAARDVGCLRDEWEPPIGYDDKRHGATKRPLSTSLV